MSEYVITCCSTADMSREFMEENKIPFAMFHYQMDGEEFVDDLYTSITPEAFYQKISDGACPVTSQINAEEYRELFEPILKSGRDVLHMTLSSGISEGDCDRFTGGFQRVWTFGDTGGGKSEGRTFAYGKCRLDRTKQAVPAPLVFFHRFNKLYPWRTHFQNGRVCGKGAEYLSASEYGF